MDKKVATEHPQTIHKLEAERTELRVKSVIAGKTVDDLSAKILTQRSEKALLSQRNTAIKNIEGTSSVVTVKTTDFEGYIQTFNEIIETNKKRQRQLPVIESGG